MLRDAEHWFADGTFDCAPEGYQLYTIHMLINQSNKTISLVYCILKNKDAITYNRVLELLMERRVLNPHSILVDFENASINVLIVFFLMPTSKDAYFILGNVYGGKYKHWGSKHGIWRLKATTRY